MKITDGKRTVDIEMKVWNGSGYDPDWSIDFFDAGSLPRNENDVYVVDDVDYCIDQAREWEAEDDNNFVFVDEL